MKRLLIVLIVAASSLAGNGAAAAETDEEVEARKMTLDVAGAFTNDGFKLRDGNWVGHLEPKASILVQVNLYAGNEYWFSAAGDAKTRKLGITVYNEAGELMETEAFADGNRVAAGFSPDASGPYFIRIEELEGAPATVCLLYSYK
jgi:hypothetical protein